MHTHLFQDAWLQTCADVCRGDHPDPLTLAPVESGQQGLVQVCRVLPTSCPGFLLLSDDMGEIIGHDSCECGRRGTHFRFLRRVPKVEVRDCGNLETTRQRRGAGHEGSDP